MQLLNELNDVIFHYYLHIIITIIKCKDIFGKFSVVQKIYI